jgi:hypothetical protein
MSTFISLHVYCFLMLANVIGTNIMHGVWGRGVWDRGRGGGVALDRPTSIKNLAPTLPPERKKPNKSDKSRAGP